MQNTSKIWILLILVVIVVAVSAGLFFYKKEANFSKTEEPEQQLSKSHEIFTRQIAFIDDAIIVAYTPTGVIVKATSGLEQEFRLASGVGTTDATQDPPAEFLTLGTEGAKVGSTARIVLELVNGEYLVNQIIVLKN